MRITPLLALLTFACLPAAADITEAKAALQKTLPGPDWRILHADAAPSLFLGPKADSPKAYRIVLRQDVKIYEPGPQQAFQFKQAEGGPGEEPKFTTAPHHVELALVDPAAKEIAPGAVTWDQKLAYRQRAELVDMGVGHGFRWLARASVQDQDALRTSLKLTGGDDPIRLAIEALAQGEGSDNTAVYAARTILLQIGVSAVAPLLVRAQLEETQPGHAEYVRQCVVTIGMIPGKGADAALKVLFESKIESTRADVAYILSRVPAREALKPVYMEMLSKQMELGYLSRVVAEAEWAEAVPVLKKACEAPVRYWGWRQAMRAIRDLENRPVPEALESAKNVLSFVDYIEPTTTPAERDAAKKVIMEHADREAVALVVLDLAHAVTKGGMRKTNRIGAEMFQALPKELTAPLLDRLKRLPDEFDRKQTLERLDPKA